MNLLSKEDLTRYYETCELWLPEKPGSRQFKLRDYKGRLLKVRRRINTTEQLRKVLLKHAPTDAWYSAAQYLNPSNVQGKERTGPGYTIADGLITSCDLPFDIDAEYTITGLEEARKRTLALTNTIKKTPKYVLISGIKGFQVVYDWNEALTADARTREEDLRNDRKRKAYIREALKYVHKKDWDVTYNPRSIIRLPCTARKNGNTATLISLEELKMPITEILKKVKTVKGNSPVTPAENGGMIRRALTARPRSYKSQGDGQPGPRPSPNIIAVSNRVGARGVLILKYDNEPALKQDIKKLSKKYALGIVHKLNLGSSFYAVGTTAFDLPHLRKMYQASRAVNKSGLLKYNKAFLRLPLPSTEVSIETGIIHNKPIIKGNPTSTFHEKLLNTQTRNVEKTTKKVQARIPIEKGSQ